MSKTTTPIIVISVFGGLVEAVYCDKPARAIVADFDNFESGDALCRELAVKKIEDADDLILEDPLIAPR